MNSSNDLGWCVYEVGNRQLPVQACGNTLSGEPDAGKSACPVRRGESGSHRMCRPLSYSTGQTCAARGTAQRAELWSKAQGLASPGNLSSNS